MQNPVLLESPQFLSYPLPTRSLPSTSQAYVLAIASLPAHYATATSTPLNTIEIYDKASLQHIQTLSGHDTATTSLKTIESIAGFSRQSLVSSGHDGSVKVWDDRSNSHSIKMTNLGKHNALLCCDVSPDGLTVAAGTDLQGDDANIFFWDPRQPATPLRTHGSTHSDDITVLQFAPDNDDEDEAVQQVANWGCSVSQAGFMASSGVPPRIWASSDMETFSTWSNELDPLQSVDIRASSVHNRNCTWVTDYLITCTNQPNGNLAIYTGSNEGDLALLSNSDLSTQNSSWTLHKIWSNGHTGVVRSLLWDENNQKTVWTLTRRRANETWIGRMTARRANDLEHTRVISYQMCVKSHTAVFKDVGKYIAWFSLTSAANMKY
ncbi:WD40-repeat-containing domain protein [Desarmillaria tabescens]|uniref:WD40-repeat-containing domain protein n=1 Tax=Armillaria tabescens TaxID=1929756 RepID=A0AA39U055_ARMTA|nr:WD40-repeat-containing domain protein [Desarmillaria tabescens]KAK0467894.1 WD40-repeat-containing domain protein [Desarmillaria tabescens]